MTRILGALESSHALPPLSYSFPYKYGRDALSWDVQRKKIYQSKDQNWFLIGHSKLVLTALVSELPTSSRELPLHWAMKQGRHPSERQQLGGEFNLLAKWPGLRFLHTCNIPASAEASKWPVWFYLALKEQEKNQNKVMSYQILWNNHSI